MKKWQLQEAKAKLSTVVKEAVLSGPQAISLRGKEAVIVISIEAYDKLIRPKMLFVKFLKKSPLFGLEPDFTRDNNPC